MSASQTYHAIVAHFDPSEQQRISRFLRETKMFDAVFTTQNGEACVRRTVSCEPDLVIVEATLAGIDGLEVMRRIKARCAETKVLFLTCYEKLLRHPITLANADYSILAPYTASLIAERALDLVRPTRPEYSVQEVFDRTVLTLTLLNAPRQMTGYPCLRDGVSLAVLDPKVIYRHAGPEGLYTQLCRRHHAPYKIIERRMRSIGERIHNSPNFLSVLGDYLSSAALERDHIPNLTLVAALAAKVSDDLRAERDRQESFHSQP